jgi:NADH-dependent peroxiredoxin subunit F
MFELIIIGGGPGAVGAGVYAARKKLKSLLIAKEIGGQSIVSSDIQNWIGTPHISGKDFALSLKAHLEEYKKESLEIQENVSVIKITAKDKEGPFIVSTSKGEEYETKSILMATGANRKKLNAKNADVYEHKGLTYCASCDGPLFGGMDVAIIGGGNAGFETAAQLLAYAKSVTLLHNSDTFKAEPVTVEKVLSNSHMRAIKNAHTIEIYGTEKTPSMVEGLVYKDATTGKEEKLSVQGIFIEIGTLPNTDLVKDLVECNEYGHIVIDPKRQRTSRKGLWAAGDCTDGLYAQNNIAVGDAVKAIEDIYAYLKA